MSNAATTSRSAAQVANRTWTSRTLRKRVRDGRLRGWLFLLPALAFYGVFVLWPLVTGIRYSFYNWDGLDAAKWVGLSNYSSVFSNPTLLSVLGHAFQLIIYFSVIPVSLGLVIAALMRRVVDGRLGTVARIVLFLPQVVPLVAAGIAWNWVLAENGALNQLFSAVGLGSITRAWLGDFTYALPAVGVIGIWVLLGFCTVLLLVGMSKIDPALYEASQLEGAGRIREFFSITLPCLRQEIGVCVIVTVVAALSAFDIVYIATSGGPGDATMVPGLEIYQLAFYNREVGLASALAVVLMALVLVFVMPIQWFVNRGLEA